MAEPALIALDWGTSSLRAWLLDGGGGVLAATRAPLGLMQVEDRAFAAAFDRVTADWPRLPALACGMIGARQGWVEAAYLPCPAGAADLARHLTRVPERDLSIIPGILQSDPANVMRGEETQVFGALALRPDLAAARIVLPGTHSKWVRLEQGRIAGFETFMTGELFAVLKAHSILGRFPGTEAPAAFAAGLRAGQAGGLSARLFSARARVLTGAMAEGEALDYLSGLLIGEEIAAAVTPGERVVLIGEPALCARYRQGLALHGAEAEEVPEATVAGLWTVAQAAGMV